MGQYLDLLGEAESSTMTPCAVRSDKSDKSAERLLPSLRSLSSQPERRTNDANEPPEPVALSVSDRALAIWGEREDERCAIIEHDGAIPRAWAEGFARLNPDVSPADVPLKRWQRFIDDTGLFLDSRFCAVAVALGWGAFDLFGCDRDRPFARIDQSGLLWLLNGGRIAMLADDTATIATPNGARLTYHRSADEPGRVLAWELAP